MDSAPLIYTWTGEAMEPLPRYHNLVNREFVVGEQYRLEIVEERSAKSHSHYFASLSEAWQNLPEGIAERFSTPEALRKFALIKTGYCDSRSIVASSKAEAQRIAAFIRPCDEFAVVTVEGCAVTEYRAKSQSLKAMGREAFQASKDAVLGYVASLIGVDREALQSARAA